MGVVPDTPAGRYTNRLFLDGDDAALFLKQHGDMTAAVEKMAEATAALAISSGGFADEVRQVRSEVEQERHQAARDVGEIREHLARIDRRFHFWPMVGRFGALVAGFGAVGFGAYELVQLLRVAL